jgi:hypothetical protein
MKIGYFCESRADQAALEVFTEGILGQSPEPINIDLEAHSVPGFSVRLTASSVASTTTPTRKH